jgi:hypothetical protein
MTPHVRPLPRRRLLAALAAGPLTALAACGQTPTLTPAPPPTAAPTATPRPAATPTAAPSPTPARPTPLPTPPVRIGLFCQPVAEGSLEVCGSFLTFWRERGGLDQIGLPLAPAFGERSLETGEVQTVQYFERARFEYLWYKPSPADVALGLLGRDATAARAAEPPFRPVDDPGDGSWFPQTGHTLRGRFRDRWQASGQIELYGFPISEEFEERGLDDGEVRLVQYFERARFEHHPEHADTSYEVQLGRLGQEVFDRRYPEA